MDEVVQAIVEAGADVVGMQEPYARRAGSLAARVPRLAAYARDLALPDPGARGPNGEWAYVLLGPGEVAAIANTHLSCCPYTPYRIVNRGFTRAEALEQERNTRLDQIREHLTALEPLLAAGVPTFFTGDFNAPSWRDWRRRGSGRGLPYAMRWPVSRAMEAAGFGDSYREMHPDRWPIRASRGRRATRRRTCYPWDVFDRIDFVWAAGPVQTSASG